MAGSLRRAGREPAARAFDAMIAATAIANGLPPHTSDPDGYAGIDDLDVVRVPHRDARDHDERPVDLDRYRACAYARTMVQDWRTRITVAPDVRSGQPTIRSMRLSVKDVFEYLAGGMTVEQLLVDFPEVTAEDIEACFAYAAEQADGSMRVA